MAATTATAPGPSARQPYHTDRHHPYQRQNKYWSDGNSAAAAAAAAAQHSTNGVATTGNERVPPSPPRSRRDASETPSIGLGVAFGQSGGGKWWDEELPQPPASLSSILDSFRRSGEGDRDLLMAILGAKKAEEERLTALIQTRLTILQAKLNIHTTAAALAVPLPAPTATSPSQAASTLPQPQISVPSPRVASPRSRPALASPAEEVDRTARGEPVERTPSLVSRGSGSSSSTSPPMSANDHLSQPPSAAYRGMYGDKDRSPYLPPPSTFTRDIARDVLPPLKLSPIDRGCCKDPISNGKGRNGLEMLLDAGISRERDL